MPRISDLSPLTVRTQSETPLTAVEPDDYVVTHRSELLDGQDRVIAKLTWDLILCDAAMDAGQDRFEVFDAASEDLLQLHHALFPMRDPRPSTTEEDPGGADTNANMPGEAMLGNVLYIELFSLHDRTYNEQHVAEHLLEHVLSRYSNSGIAAFIQGPEDSLPFVRAVEARGLALISAPPRVYAFGTAAARPPLPSTDH